MDRSSAHSGQTVKVPPRISVIVPIYNIEKYLRDAIDSVIRQDIGFETNIEILLVDDGSQDGSQEIAREYAIHYASNVTYIRQKNAGVSRARNAGLRKATGEYVHFFDGDDILPKNFYTRMVQFLDSERSVDFVAAKLLFFDAIIDSHPLNNKFHTDRIIDVKAEPNAPLLHVISCVFRREALADVMFDEELKIAEDVKFISDVLRIKGRYGVTSRTMYHYRKRVDASSAIGGKENKRYYYLDTPVRSYQYMLDSWKGSGSLWAEYTVLYDTAYRLKQKDQSILTKQEEADYRDKIMTMIASCSDTALVTNPFMSLQKKLYALERKYGADIRDRLHAADDGVYFDTMRLCRYEDLSVHIDFLSAKEDDTYLIEGYVKNFSHHLPVEIFLRVGEKDHQLTYVHRAQREESFLGEQYNDGGAFEVKFSLPVDAAISFFATGGKASPHKVGVDTGPFTSFGALKLTYRRDADRLIKRTPRALVSHPYSRLLHLGYELRMMAQIMMNWRFGTAKTQLRKLKSRNLTHLSVKARLFEVAKPFLFIAEAVYMIPRALVLRTCYYVAKWRKKRPLWLVSDRGMAAGDNGEAFFRYLVARPDVPADVFFVISKKSKDYDRIRQIGPVLRHGSLRHKLKHLIADKIISSQADVETTNPFIRQFDHYADLMRFEFVFLQHGVIRHDLSGWLNRFNKNIGLFVVTAKKEYDSIFSNPYYYQQDHVILSGLPRYDQLTNDPQGKIILAPTYRKNLARMKTDKNGERKYDPLFKMSDYRNFYNNLMNDERLRAVMKKYGVVGEFYLHPAFSSQRADFTENDDFTMMKFPYNYNRAFREGSLMISDHSSVMFDFAYLRKPVLYAHFDIDTFFAGHTYDQSDFFSDVDDGFGEVCYDYESLVTAVIASIERDFELADKYRQRIDTFFAFNDTSNAERLYDGVIKNR